MSNKGPLNYNSMDLLSVASDLLLNLSRLSDSLSFLDKQKIINNCGNVWRKEDLNGLRESAKINHRSRQHAKNRTPENGGSGYNS